MRERKRSMEDILKLFCDMVQIDSESSEEAAAKIGATVDINVSLEYKVSRIPEDSPTVTLAKEAIAATGLTPKAKVITGGTDLSIFKVHGIETPVLGVGVKAEHSKDEHIAIADMERGRSRLSTTSLRPWYSILISIKAAIGTMGRGD